MTAWVPFAGDALAVGGTAALTLAVLGILRISDVRARVHAASKGAVLGVIPVLLAGAASGKADLAARAILVAAFLMVTTPVGSHAVMRLCELGGEEDADAPASPEEASDP